MAHELVRSCSLRTERLVVGEWHNLADGFGLDLVEVIGGVLTPATTDALPPEWHGQFDDDRATRWLKERDGESATLLVVDRQTRSGIGFVILFEAEREDDSPQVDVRLGYMLAESVWGQGLATELVAAIVEWARSQPAIGSLSGGVAEQNEASARVLLKSGFHPAQLRDGEQTYEIRC